MEVYRHLQVGLARSTMGYRYHLLLNTGMALVVLGLPAAMIGAVLPLWIREGGRDAASLGGHVGRLLTWNTLGAVAGSLLAGFVLMPALGLRGSFGVMVLVLSGVAALVAWIAARPNLAITAAILGGGLAVACLTGGGEWQYVLSSGVFRARETEVAPGVMALRKQTKQILLYEDAADATVTVEKSLAGSMPGEISLRINGKTDASTGGDLSTQYLLAHLPMLARPDGQDIFVLGFGSGITAGALLGHPVRQIAIAENCAAVMRAAPLFAPWNRGVHTNALARVWRQDGRTLLKLSPRRYDVIISEPSNPWMVGIGSVFSREFFELAARRLKDDGVMAQWFHLYEMHDGIVALVLRTFGAVFPHVEIWDVSGGDIILLGSRRPWPSTLESYRRVFAREQPRQDLAAIGLGTPEALWARQLTSQRTAFAIPGEGPLQSDAFPVLEYEAPRAFYLGQKSLLLNEYDERTWQWPLATGDKRSCLAALGEEALRAAFTTNTSVNVDLEKYFSLRFNPMPAMRALDIYAGDRLVPCLFRPPGLAAANSVAPAGANDAERRLWQAEQLLQHQPAQGQAALATLTALLRAAPLQSGPSTNTVPLAHYAALAARVSLGQGDYALTGELLALGLQREPRAPHLLYLARILVREQPQQAR